MKKEIIFCVLILFIGIGLVYAECTDSDGGLDYDIEGEVYDNVANETYTDYCSQNTVNEYWCDEDVVSLDSYLCFETCSDGACADQSIQECTESDGGKNYYEQGWAQATIDGQLDKNYDTCFDSNTLSENYCLSEPDAEGKTYKKENYLCSEGCINGACSSEGISCIDSDGGIDYNKTGSATKFGTENTTDVCEDSTTLKEYYCENNEITSKTYACVYVCKSGKCMTEQEEAEIECEVNDDCDDGYSDDYCIENSIYHDYNDYSCFGGKCQSTPDPQEIGTCVNKCEAGKCVDKLSESSGNESGNSETESDGIGFFQKIINWFKRLFGGE